MVAVGDGSSDIDVACVGVAEMTAVRVGVGDERGVVVTFGCVASSCTVVVSVDDGDVGDGVAVAWLSSITMGWSVAWASATGCWAPSLLSPPHRLLKTSVLSKPM